MHHIFSGGRYTQKARAFALRYPKLNFILTQINFWIIAFILLVIILNLDRTSTSKMFDIQIRITYGSSSLTAIIGGILYGIILGFMDIWIDQSSLKNRSMGLIILIRVVAYLLIVIAVISFVRYILWELFINPYLIESRISAEADIAWKYLSFILLAFTLFLSPIITFINLMNRKFGPGVLIPMMFGRYRNPREEERIFMFMDLKSSTTHAEKLGHMRYSALIRDSFMDINQVLTKYNAEIYQYVGDEIVISWQVTSDIKGISCVEFFFACQDQFHKRYSYYMENYGFVPQFKAGLHLGLVTAVEVGEIKRDIAYHGDTLNTAARIQSVCNQYQKLILVSGQLKDFAALDEHYITRQLGDITLKGKAIPVELFSVEEKKQTHKQNVQ